MRLLVIADDLTGASETGVHFAETGLATEVFVDIEHACDPPGSAAQVCVVDTESRHLASGAADRR